MTPEIWDAMRIAGGFCIGIVVGFSLAAAFVMAGGDRE